MLLTTGLNGWLDVVWNSEMAATIGKSSKYKIVLVAAPLGVLCYYVKDSNFPEVISKVPDWWALVDSGIAHRVRSTLA